MLTPEQIQRFHEDGFLNSGPVLPDGEVDAITDGLEEVLEIGPDGFAEGRPRPVLFHDMKSRGGGVSPSPVWQIVNIWEAHPAFERLIYHPFVVKAVSQLTGQRDLQVWHDQIQYKPASAGGPTNWHQDAPLWPIIKPMTPVSAWIPMDDADEENGCMWMVPGSHRWGNQIEFLRTQRHLEDLADFSAIEGFEPPDGTDVTEVRPRPWPVRRGEISFHHSLTWHGSPHNTSGRPRRAIAIHYMTGEARFDASGNHVMKQFVELPDGAPMAGAGPHFPVVCRSGRPVGAPERLGSAAG